MRPKKKKKRYFRRSGHFFVYILECGDGTYYTGYTNDLKNRLKLHNSGRGAKYTMMRPPVAVVWKKKYRQFRSAFKTETLIKRLLRRQKEALVSGRPLREILALKKKGCKKRERGLKR